MDSAEILLDEAAEAIRDNEGEIDEAQEGVGGIDFLMDQHKAALEDLLQISSEEWILHDKMKDGHCLTQEPS